VLCCGQHVTRKAWAGSRYCAASASISALLMASKSLLRVRHQGKSLREFLAGGEHRAEPVGIRARGLLQRSQDRVAWRG